MKKKVVEDKNEVDGFVEETPDELVMKKYEHKNGMKFPMWDMLGDRAKELLLKAPMNK